MWFQFSVPTPSSSEPTGNSSPRVFDAFRCLHASAHICTRDAHKHTEAHMHAHNQRWILRKELRTIIHTFEFLGTAVSFKKHLYTWTLDYLTSVPVSLVPILCSEEVGLLQVVCLTQDHDNIHSRQRRTKQACSTQSQWHLPFISDLGYFCKGLNESLRN